jgi:hypothetical protein
VNSSAPTSQQTRRPWLSGPTVLSSGPRRKPGNLTDAVHSSADKFDVPEPEIAGLARF